jgi:hypothetical protein
VSLVQADKLCGLQNQHEAEIAALAKCRQLVGRASFALEKKRRVSLYQRLLAGWKLQSKHFMESLQ